MSEAEAHRESLRRMARAPRYNDWLFERARPHLRGRVLDVGAGTGTFAKLVAEIAESVVALEPEQGLVPLLRKSVAAYPNVTVVEDTAEEVAEAGLGPFDAIVCLNVLEHVPDDEAALRSFHRALVPSGRLLLLVPAHPLLHGAIDETVGHVRRYRRSELGRALARAGLRVEELRHVNPLGALGWFVSSRLLRRPHVPEGALAAYDRLVPLLAPIDGLPSPFGLSLWAVATRADYRGLVSAPPRPVAR